MMLRFIGTKEVEGQPMTRGEYNTYRGWTIPDGENPEDRGYLVKYKDGYISWCPEKQFLEANNSDGSFTFGDAVYLLKQGKAVARAGWNGKGMYLVLVHPDQYQVDTFFENLPNDPWIGMRTATGSLVPWLASQTDALAEDWNEVVFTLDGE